jgi:hypothetical protein
MVSEDIRQVPGLYMAWVEPGQSEPVYLNDRIIPETFTAWFHFKDKSKTWLVEFHIKVADTPLLTSVTTHGSQINNGDRDTIQRWQLKVIEQYRYQLLELAVELAITTRTPTVMLRREYNAENMAMLRAITGLGHKPNQTVLEHPSTITGTLKSGEPVDFVRFWDGNPEPITGKELKALQRDIGKSVRRRVTDKFLKEIAGVYTRAVLDGLDPYPEIMAIYKCAHRTAQEWATKARAPHLGFLPPTTPGKVTVGKTKTRKGKK